MSDVHIYTTVDEALARSLPQSASLVGKRVEIILREVEPSSSFPAGYSPLESVPEDEPDWDPDGIERLRIDRSL